MNSLNRLLLLGLTTLLCIVYAWMLRPMPQDPAYHLFADQQRAAGIANFGNVVSNLPFLFVGIYGVWLLIKCYAARRIKMVYGVMFTGIFLTGIGSAYYHYAPDNNSLVFDRLPMVLVFMAFFSAAIMGWINAKAVSYCFCLYCYWELQVCCGGIILS